MDATETTTLNDPEFQDKYQIVPNDQRQQGIAFVRQKEVEGYAFFSRAFPRSRAMVGDLSGEWRVLDSFLLLKTLVPLVELQARQFPDIAVVMETHKHFADMSSVGRSLEYAEFTRADLEAWADFFKMEFTAMSDPRPVSEMFI
jgi:hypothetical protein